MQDYFKSILKWLYSLSTLFVKRHDYVVSQIILFQHKNAKNFFFLKQTSKWNVNIGETQNIWTYEVPPGLFYVF